MGTLRHSAAGQSWPGEVAEPAHRWLWENSQGLAWGAGGGGFLPEGADFPEFILVFFPPPCSSASSKIIRLSSVAAAAAAAALEGSH